MTGYRTELDRVAGRVRCGLRVRCSIQTARTLMQYLSRCRVSGTLGACLHMCMAGAALHQPEPGWYTHP